jgi:DNA-binding NarL/FixJ family response regulator
LLEILGPIVPDHRPPANDRSVDISYQLMVAVAQAPTAIVICDARFRPIFANDAARQLVGLSATEALPTRGLGKLVTACARGREVIDVHATLSRFGAAETQAGILITATIPDTMAARDEDLIRRSQRLSERERDVVLGLLQGGSNKSIGLMLKLSPRTVEFHRAKLMRRFGAKSLMGLRAAILLDAAPPASDKR